MIKPILKCPNQEKKNKRITNHPCKNCKWFNQSAFRQYGAVRFCCDYPDGAFLQYEIGDYCFRNG